MTAEAVPQPAHPVRPERFRHVLGHFATGIVVISSRDGELPVGFAVNSFTSVSLEPPLVSFCAGRASDTWPSIRRAGVFAVNILGADQARTSRAFASKNGDRYAGVRWRPAPATGSPLLAGAVGWIDCEIDRTFDAGDHEIVVGRVLDLDVVDGSPAPLLFYCGGYRTAVDLLSR